MEENFLFLLQSAKLIKSGHYNEKDIEFINELVLSIDNNILNGYNKSTSLIILGNDLDFYIKLLNFLIKHYESVEDYEKCQILKNKLDESLKIKKEKNEYT